MTKIMTIGFGDSPDRSLFLLPARTKFAPILKNGKILLYTEISGENNTTLLV